MMHAKINMFSEAFKKASETSEIKEAFENMGWDLKWYPGSKIVETVKTVFPKIKEAAAAAQKAKKK